MLIKVEISSEERVYIPIEFEQVQTFAVDNKVVVVGYIREEKDLADWLCAEEDDSRFRVEIHLNVRQAKNLMGFLEGRKPRKHELDINFDWIGNS